MLMLSSLAQHIAVIVKLVWGVQDTNVIVGLNTNIQNRSFNGTKKKGQSHMSRMLNHKRRKKMKRKIKRQDVGWETVLAEMTKYEINLAKKGTPK